MPNQLPLDIHLFQTSQDVNSICQDFFNATGLSYFQYTKLFDDGSITGLLSNTNTLKRFIELDFPSFSSFKESDRNKKSYWFFWDEELPWLPVQIGRDNGIYHGLTLLKRNKGNYDMIGFGMPEERSGAATYYMNNLDMLNSYIDEFENDNRGLIDFTLKNKIQMPKDLQDSNCKKIPLKNNSRFTLENGTYITSREYDCLKLRIKAMTYKEIARILNISPRCVETYLYRMKDRTKIGDLHKIARAL